MQILLIQGANMEFLGQRKPEWYSTTTTAALDELLMAAVAKRSLTLDIAYTNLKVPRSAGFIRRCSTA